MRRLLPSCVLLAFQAFVGRNAAAVPATHPRVIELEFSNMIQSPIVYRADGLRAHMEMWAMRKRKGGKWQSYIERQVDCVPPPELWRNFWNEVEEVGVTRWKPTYDQLDLPSRNADHIVTTDNENWKLKLTGVKGARRATGDGAYPVAGHPEQVTGDFRANGVTHLEAAFDRLLK